MAVPQSPVKQKKTAASSQDSSAEWLCRLPAKTFIVTKKLTQLIWASENTTLHVSFFLPPMNKSGSDFYTRNSCARSSRWRRRRSTLGTVTSHFSGNVIGLYFLLWLTEHRGGGFNWFREGHCHSRLSALQFSVERFFDGWIQSMQYQIAIIWTIHFCFFHYLVSLTCNDWMLLNWGNAGKITR